MMHPPLSGAALAQALLHPETVALVGSSDDTAKTAGRPLLFLRRAGFAGTIYNVNPMRETVQDEQSYPSLAALPRRPDHAFILTGTAKALDSVEECGRLGVPVITILAGGFSEAGPEGATNEARLRDIRARYHTRILGPSSLGLVNMRDKLVLTANAAFAEPDLPLGGIFCASHSGSLIGALTSRGKSRGIGFHSLVSVGIETDVSIGEICSATLDDDQVSGYLLFLESLRHAEDLRRFALAAAEHGKPIVAYKLGRSKAAADLTVSHTGALAGEDEVADALIKDCGIARVETFEGLLEALPLLNRMPRHCTRRKPAVGVVTTTGGGAAMAVDQLAVRGVEVAAPTPTTLKRMADAGIHVSPGRLVDLTLAGTRYDVMKTALDIMQTAPEFDLVLATVGSSARFQPDLAVKPIIDSGDGATPIAAFIVPDAPQALEHLSAAGVPNFRTPESCADVIAAAFTRRAPNSTIISPRAVRQPHALDEAEAYGVFDRVGIAHAPFRILSTKTDNANLPFPYPVAVKALHAGLAHKTDAGGVVLNVRSARDLERSIGQIAANIAALRPEIPVEHVLVQPMIVGIAEVLIGFRRDPNAGPVVTVAAGGIFTELCRDRALRLAPVDLEAAVDMVGEVKALHALAGYRGKPAGDLEALAHAVVAISRLACLEDVIVVEAEINPLIVSTRGQGVVAVDAMMRVG